MLYDYITIKELSIMLFLVSQKSCASECSHVKKGLGCKPIVEYAFNMPKPKLLSLASKSNKRKSSNHTVTPTKKASALKEGVVVWIRMLGH